MKTTPKSDEFERWFLKYYGTGFIDAGHKYDIVNAFNAGRRAERRKIQSEIDKANSDGEAYLDEKREKQSAKAPAIWPENRKKNRKVK